MPHVKVHTMEHVVNTLNAHNIAVLVSHCNSSKQSSPMTPSLFSRRTNANPGTMAAGKTRSGELGFDVSNNCKVTQVRRPATGVESEIEKPSLPRANMAVLSNSSSGDAREYSEKLKDYVSPLITRFSTLSWETKLTRRQDCPRATYTLLG